MTESSRLAVDRIFAQVLDGPTEEWSKRLEELTPGDTKLRAAVEAKLRSAQMKDTLLDERAPLCGPLGKELVRELTERRARPEPRELAAGARLGPYEIRERIGAGGMGEVYRARDLRLERDVAMKVLSERLAEDSAALSRFEREAKAVAALSHPNILAIHDFGQSGRVSFAVMELLEGETLRGRLARSELPWREAAEVGVSIAEGLAAAHARGIVHRDLKPENVFLTSDGQVKILDFGLARRDVGVFSTSGESGLKVTAQTEPGTILGTVGYMAPEQVSGQPADARSDLFAFGCVLYEMVTGKPAFSGRTGAERLAAILKEEPADPAEGGRRLPEALTRVIRQCLEKSPERRAQPARDLAYELKALLAAPAATFATTSRRKMLTIIAAAAGVAAIALMASQFVRSPQGRGPAAPAKLSALAVLPLRNLSRDPAQEFFADGMTEELINQLAQIGALKVISHPSVMKYKGTTKTTPEIGRELKVDAVITGSISRFGGRVRIIAQLVRTATDETILAERYERDLDDVLSLQNEVARAIARRIEIELTPDEQVRLSERRSVNPAAHEAYLRGRFYWNVQDPEGFLKGIVYFQEAIEKDPTYAQPYAGLADTFSWMAFYGMLLPAEGFPRARQAAVKALQLDPNLPEAHSALGRVLHNYDWNWAAAEKEYRRAIELNPSYALAHQQYSIVLTTVGRLDEALAEARKALELDPFSLVTNHSLAWVYYLARRYEDSVQQYRATIELFPRFPNSLEQLAGVYEAKGENENAFRAYRNWAEVAGLPAETLADLDRAYAAGGIRGYWKKRLELEVREEEETGNVWTYRRAEIHARAGEREEAFRWLDKAYAERSNGIVFLALAPAFDALRPDARFAGLLQRLRLPHAQKKAARSGGYPYPQPREPLAIMSSLEIRQRSRHGRLTRLRGGV